MVQQNQDPFCSFDQSIIRSKEFIWASMRDIVPNPNACPRLCGAVHRRHGKETGQSGWTEGNTLIDHVFMNIIIWHPALPIFRPTIECHYRRRSPIMELPVPHSFLVAKLSGSSRVEEFISCVNQGLPHITANSPRFAGMLETARNEYKATYDKLIKFEQDHCTVQAASAPWPTLKRIMRSQLHAHMWGGTERQPTWSLCDVPEEGCELESHHEPSQACNIIDDR